MYVVIISNMNNIRDTVTCDYSDLQAPSELLNPCNLLYTRSLSEAPLPLKHNRFI